MIEVSHLTRRYGQLLAVEDVSFSLQPGRIYGFLGPNGAGKSTTMNILTGYLSAAQGSVTVNGWDVFEEPLQARRQIGYLPENPPLYMDMTVKEYLRFMYDLKGCKLPREKHMGNAVYLHRSSKMIRYRIFLSNNRIAISSEPDYLIVIKLFSDGSWEEVYNGPGNLVWDNAGKIQKNGQRPISLSKLKSLMTSVDENERILRIK